VRICEWLAKNATWNAGQLYSVNVPVKKGVTDAKVRFTKMLQNQWEKGACFQELPSATSVDDAASEEAALRRKESMGGGGNEDDSGTATPANKWAHRHFKWAPRFTDVYNSVEKYGPGSDGWAVKEGECSITALMANFMHAEGFDGEVKL
jgi:broad specificity polyphosphatase/5'/3'-nucleotidase SurE